MAIQQCLSKFPLSGSVWAEYHIDQEINDRGVALDLTLVQAAIEMDTRSRKELMAAMQKITALENPNSVQQMKQWRPPMTCAVGWPVPENIRRRTSSQKSPLYRPV